MNEKLCIICKEPATIMHHTDYKKDETIPVCNKCHKGIHSSIKSKYYPKGKPYHKSLVIATKAYDELFDIKLKLSKKYNKPLSMSELIRLMVKIVDNQKINFENKKENWHIVRLTKKDHQKFLDTKLKIMKKLNKKITDADAILFLIDEINWGESNGGTI